MEPRKINFRLLVTSTLWPFHQLVQILKLKRESLTANTVESWYSHTHTHKTHTHTPAHLKQTCTHRNMKMTQKCGSTIPFQILLLSVTNFARTTGEHEHIGAWDRFNVKFCAEGGEGGGCCQFSFSFHTRPKALLADHLLWQRGVRFYLDPACEFLLEVCLEIHQNGGCAGEDGWLAICPFK